jgi:hypothetical protein
MNLVGAKIEEIVGIINYISKNGEWKKVNEYWLMTGSIAGINLTVRQKYYDTRLISISILGSGWLVSFAVNKRRPHTFPADKISVDCFLVLPLVSFTDETYLEKFCLHSECVLSPELFKTQMSLLRLFNSEWS